MIGEPETDDSDAARDARLCGAIDRTGSLYETHSGSGFDARKFRTSVCDWSVISTDSADVMQPLEMKSVVRGMRSSQ